MDDYTADVNTLEAFNKGSSFQLPIPTRDEWIKMRLEAHKFDSIQRWDIHEQTLEVLQGVLHA